MEANNVSCADWAVNRRAESLVNKQEDMAVGTVQRPSEHMHPLPRESSDDIPGQAEMNFHSESESFKSAAMTVKCMHEEETSLPPGNVRRWR